VSGKDINSLKNIFSREEEIIIKDFEEIKEPSSLNFEYKRVIAIAKSSVDKRVVDEKFGFIYYLPPLKERPEDIKILSNYFLKDAKKTLMVDVDISIPQNRLDISKNILSLKASIYKEVLLASLNSKDIEEALFNYFFNNIDGNNAYRENLGILERPMLKAGLKKFGSQLKLSEVLGINRNTLRKKLYEYNIY